MGSIEAAHACVVRIVAASVIREKGRSVFPDLRVRDRIQLPARTELLKKAGFHFRNQMEVGPGGKEIQLEDPDGTPIELFEPAR